MATLGQLENQTRDYLKVEDLEEDRQYIYSIREIGLKTFGAKKEIIVYFNETNKGLILNTENKKKSLAFACEMTWSELQAADLETLKGRKIGVQIKSFFDNIEQKTINYLTVELVGQFLDVEKSDEDVPVKASTDFEDRLAVDAEKYKSDAEEIPF